MDRLQVKNPLYPLVCLGCAIALLIGGLLCAKSPVFPFFVLAVCLLYTVFGLGIVTLKCFLVFVPVSLIFALFSFLFARNLTVASQMGCRVLLMGLSAVPLVTLPPINLTRCLTSLGCPRILTLGMLISIRFVPIIGDEVHRVCEAMRTRGVGFSFYRAFIIPVMMRIINISETMTLSLETRAFSVGNEPVSAVEEVRFSIRDIIYCICCAALLAGLAVAM